MCAVLFYLLSLSSQLGQQTRQKACITMRYLVYGFPSVVTSNTGSLPTCPMKLHWLSVAMMFVSFVILLIMALMLLLRCRVMIFNPVGNLYCLCSSVL